LLATLSKLLYFDWMGYFAWLVMDSSFLVTMPILQTRGNAEEE
jgi:hypothetical protein